MTTATVETQITELRGQFADLKGDVGELKGEVRGLGKRMDDMHRLLMVLMGIAGGGLATALIGIVLQFAKG